MPVRILDSAVPQHRLGAVIFQSEDEQGLVEVWVTPSHWEDLWLQAPDPATDEDRLNFAFGMIERTASACTPSMTAEGARVVFVG